MHLLFLTDRYAPEARAAAYLSQELAEALVAEGHRVTVVTRMPSRYVPGGLAAPRAETLRGVRVIRVGGLGFLNRALFLRPLDHILTSAALTLRSWMVERPDVVVVYSPPLPMAMTAALTRWWRGIPYVLNLHDLYPATVVELGLLKNKMLVAIARWMESVAYRNAEQIVVAAPRSAAILHQHNGVPEAKLTYVPNMVNTERFTPGPRDNAFRRAEKLGDRFVVLYAGLMGVAQDLGTIVDCARRMRARTDVMFVLMGDGVFAAKWKALAADLPNVRFCGSVANDGYLEALRASDVCLVSLSDQLKSPAIPGKMATIMAAGKPMIAVVPAWSDTIDVLRESRSGLVSASGCPEELQRAIERLAADPRLAAELGENARAYATSRLSVASVVPQFERVAMRATAAGVVRVHQWRGVSP